mmetsp:Transcript_37519/g.85141  ORF Transcript_37519/g.85141 Transcript_37519/m.85141 type:complete len:159 (+) Transcript_37519:45-521(+)
MPPSAKKKPARFDRSQLPMEPSVSSSDLLKAAGSLRPPATPSEKKQPGLAQLGALKASGSEKRKLPPKRKSAMGGGDTGPSVIDEDARISNELAGVAFSPRPPPADRPMLPMDGTRPNMSSSRHHRVRASLHCDADTDTNHGYQGNCLRKRSRLLLQR